MAEWSKTLDQHHWSRGWPRLEREMFLPNKHWTKRYREKSKIDVLQGLSHSYLNIRSIQVLGQPFLVLSRRVEVIAVLSHPLLEKTLLRFEYRLVQTGWRCAGWVGGVGWVKGRGLQLGRFENLGRHQHGFIIGRFRGLKWCVLSGKRKFSYSDRYFFYLPHKPIIFRLFWGLISHQFDPFRVGIIVFFNFSGILLIFRRSFWWGIYEDDRRGYHWKNRDPN